MTHLEFPSDALMLERIFQVLEEEPLEPAVASGEAGSGAAPTLEGLGVVLRFWDVRGGIHGCAGRIGGHPRGLFASLQEAAWRAAHEDPRFGNKVEPLPAAPGPAPSRWGVSLWLLRPGEAIDDTHPLRPGEGVAVSAQHKRGSALPERSLSSLMGGPDKSAEATDELEAALPEDLLGRACVAAGLSPTAWRREAVELTRLEILHRVDRAPARP